jgi:hypothetical protein
MKKTLEIMAFALVALPLIGANVEVKYSGPSGQGDVIYKATATGVTNMVMGTGGLYNVTLDPRYPVTGVNLLPGNLTLANTYMILGNASGVGAAATPAAIRTNLSLVVGTDVQAYDADLTTWAGITPSANAQALLLLSYAAMRTNLNLVIGTDVQAYDSDLTTWAGISPSANAQALLLLTYAAMRTNLNLVVGTDVQAYDAQLDTWSGVTPSANGQSLVAAADYSAMRTNLGLVVGTDVQAYDADLDKYAANNGGSITGVPITVSAQNVTRTNVTGVTGQTGATFTNYDIVTPEYASVTTNYVSYTVQYGYYTNYGSTGEVLNAYQAPTGFVWTTVVHPQVCTNVVLGNYVAPLFLTGVVVATETQISTTNATATNP